MEKTWLIVVAVVGLTFPIVTASWSILVFWFQLISDKLLGRSRNKMVFTRSDGTVIGMFDLRKIGTEDPKKLGHLLSAMRQTRGTLKLTG